MCIRMNGWTLTVFIPKTKCSFSYRIRVLLLHIFSATVPAKYICRFLCLSKRFILQILLSLHTIFSAMLIEEVAILALILKQHMPHCKGNKFPSEQNANHASCILCAFLSSTYDLLCRKKGNYTRCVSNNDYTFLS